MFEPIFDFLLKIVFGDFLYGVPVWEGEKSARQVSDTPQFGFQLRCAGHNLGAPGGDALIL